MLTPLVENIPCMFASFVLLCVQVSSHLKTSYSTDTIPQSMSHQRIRRTVVTRVHEAVKAIALCHNVTPVYENDDDPDSMTYQASSPDEVILSSYMAEVGHCL